MAALLLILTTLAIVGLAVTSMGCLARQRAARAVHYGLILLAVIAVCAATLVVVSLASQPRTLADGQWQCFDD